MTGAHPASPAPWAGASHFTSASTLTTLFFLFACGDGEDPSHTSATYTNPPTQSQPPVPTPPTPPDEAKFEITSVNQSITSYKSPSLIIIVKNTGTKTGYNVSCYAHAHNNEDVIIDTARAFFADLGNITPGKSAQDEAVFWNLKSHNEYKSLSYECTWLTRK